LNIAREENIFDPVHLLDPGVVDSDPDRFLVGLEYSCFEFDSLPLYVLMSVNIDLPDNCFSFLKGRLVECYPDFAFGRYEMIE
jgi:hypothetical protein